MKSSENNLSNRLYLLCGIPFSGKSTLAKKIVEQKGFTRIDLDEVKVSIFGDKILDSQIDQFGWDKIYQDMYRKIKNTLISGQTVVHDTGNFTRAEREVVIQIAKDLNIQTTTIFVDIPTEIAYQRLLDNRLSKARFDVSDIDFNSTVAELEVPGDTENSLTFKYTDDLHQWINQHL